MPTDKLSLHANAVNLARRYSVQNENDLLQENYYEEIEAPKKFDHDTCKELSNHLMHLNALPAECRKFQDVVSGLRRRDTDTTDPTSILS